MNPLNYATIEASKRLVDAGIVLETEAEWIIWPTGYTELARFSAYSKEYQSGVAGILSYPAPCMAEVWRELPYGSRLFKDDCHTDAWIGGNEDGRNQSYQDNTNPTDALIDLLIWTRKGKP